MKIVLWDEIFDCLDQLENYTRSGLIGAEDTFYELKVLLLKKAEQEGVRKGGE